MDELAVIFGERLENEMTLRGLSPEDFEFAGICSASAIKGHIGFDHAPTLSTAIKIADFLGVSLDYLCGRDGNGPSANVDNDRKAPWL